MENNGGGKASSIGNAMQPANNNKDKTVFTKNDNRLTVSMGTPTPT
jgi:hypothetical protein